ncbi:MAG: hypothetical protein M1825_005905 [Sarcosagium campestre]|nr:MAG: hypothetical protein M1825_005905 [Sarcosagium campestre]
MAGPTAKRRKVEDAIKRRNARPKKKKGIRRKQAHYDSDSSLGEEAPSTPTTPEATVPWSRPKGRNQKDKVAEKDSSDAEESGGSSDSNNSNSSANSASELGAGKKRKRNDPEAFATSISKILSTKLSTSKRQDPVLSRSKTAADAGHEIAEAKLEARARHKLREEKKASLDKGRVRDVLGVEGADTESGAGTAAQTLETEKRLKKTAQRGVVKLFNAVRAAQVKAEQAARETRKGGVVGVGRREEKVTEMSKRGFLELIASGGTKQAPQVLGEV